MKNFVVLAIMLVFFGATAQVSLTKEGYSRVKRKPIETTLSDSDSLNVSKSDGIIRGISFADFKNILPFSNGSEFIKVTPSEYLVLTPTELAENDYIIVDSKASASTDFMYESVYDSDMDNIVDNSERLVGQLPSYYLDFTNFTNVPIGLADGDDDTQRTDEEIEDIIGTKIIGGTNVTISYNDTTGETTINSTASGGGGDMLESVYDTDGNGIVDDSELFNGLASSQFLRSDINGEATGDLIFSGSVSVKDPVNSGTSTTSKINFTDSADSNIATVGFITAGIAGIRNNNGLHGITFGPTTTTLTGLTGSGTQMLAITSSGTVLRQAIPSAGVTQSEGFFNVTVGGTSGGTFATITPVDTYAGYYIQTGNEVKYWIAFTASSPSGISGALYIDPDFAFSPRSSPNTYTANIGGASITGGADWNQLFAFMSNTTGRIQFNYSSTAPSNSGTSAYPAPTTGAVTVRLSGTFLIN
ncbi:hypothetical protein [Flagellimonas sp.]|uniref:hypothetical protein n=1 Tax=Flagellimonas sp. TaxID=2058762 RepID=UPI003BA8F757